MANCVPTNQKRMRKNREQLKALKRLYEQSESLWTKEEQMMIARQLGLKEQQVYKWCWDQIQKRRKSSDESDCQPINRGRKMSCDDEFEEAVDEICESLGIDMQPYVL